MARPVATAPTITPILRGKSLCIRYKFRGIDFKQSLNLPPLDADQVGATGYLKRSHPEHVALNQQVEAAADRYRLATDIALAAADLTAARIASEYDRLSQEAAKQAAADALAAQVESIRPALSARASYHVADKIEEKKLELAALQAEYDNLQRAAGRYEDDKFTTFIGKYVAAQTCSKSTIRNFNSFAKVVTEYAPHAKVQEIGEDWIAAFVNWLFVTPVTITYPCFKRVNGKLTKTGKISSTKTLPPRKNGTIGDYVMKIKTILNYFVTRPTKLPAGCIIDTSYKNYSFDLASKEEIALTLTWDEVCELFALRHFEKPTHEMARDLFVLLCSTGLRQIDLQRINPTTITDGEIVLVAQKTEQHQIKVKIPLNAISAAILHKYNYDIGANAKMRDTDLNERITEILNYKQGGNYVLPTFQIEDTLVQFRNRDRVERRDTRANLITSHVGRKTFINYCLDNGIDCTDVQLMSGHRDINTLLVYKDKRKSMKKQLTGMFEVPAHLAHLLPPKLLPPA